MKFALSAALLTLLSSTFDNVDSTDFALVRCGNGSERAKWGCTPKLVSKTEKYGVRCCSQEKFYRAKKRTRGPSCNYYAGSVTNIAGPGLVDGSGPRPGLFCPNELTFDQAQTMCKNLGADICTRKEMSSGCTKVGPCKGMNRKLVWVNDSVPTSTPTFSSSPTPAPIVSSGGFHACAIDALHKLFCWGQNSWGQVGTGNGEVMITSPTVIEVDNDPKEISLGWDFSCILDTLTKVWCWGRNSHGQLGLGHNGHRFTPTEVTSVSGAVKVFAGGEHICILNIMKEVWCWGRNYYGQLGTGITSFFLNTPTEVVGLNSNISSMSLGQHHTCALDILSQLYCWGWNEYGQLGLGHTTNKSTPTKVVFKDSHMVKVSLGMYHSCIVNNLSQVWCWGGNYWGELGDDTTTQRTSPTRTSLATSASKFDVGWNHSCVIDDRSDLWCWGRNDHAQLGLGTHSHKRVPTKVTAVVDVVQVSAGGHSTVLVDGNDNIMSMGWNNYGQLGLGDTTDRNIPTLLTGI